MNQEELLRRNGAVIQWGKAQIGPLKSEIRGLGIKNYTGQMRRFLRDKYFRWHGRINGVGFAMPQHAVFVHKGVGRGYPIDASAGRALGLSNTKKRKALLEKGYNKKAVGRFLSNSDKLGAKTRKPKPWFNPVIDRAVPQLANTVAKHNADILEHNIYIL